MALLYVVEVDFVFLLFSLCSQGNELFSCIIVTD